MKPIWLRGLTVGKLRTILDGLPEHTPIVMSGSDHSLDRVWRAGVEQVGFDPDTAEMWEPEDEEKTIQVVRIGE